MPWISTSARRQATRLAGTDDLTVALFHHDEEQKRRTRLVQENSFGGAVSGSGRGTTYEVQISIAPRSFSGAYRS